MFRVISVFYGTTMALAIGFPVVMWVNGWSVTDGVGLLFVLLIMWAPAIGRLVATRTVDPEWVAPLPMVRWGRPRGWVFGWPLLCVVFIYSLAYGMGAGLGWSEWAPQWDGPGKIAINLVINVPLVIAIGLLGSIGEELGWRGYLQPRLDQAGVRGSVPIVVILSSIYHLPIMVLGGYLVADGGFWAIPLFFVAEIGISFVWAHGCYAMVSLWPAVWFHAIHNGLSQGIFPKLFSGGDDHVLLGETGLLPTLSYLLVAGIIFLRMRRAGQSWADLARGALQAPADSEADAG